MKKLFQRLIGIALIAVSVFILYHFYNGTIPDTVNIWVAFIAIPFGVFLTASRRDWFAD